MKFLIVTPSFNRATYLNETIESVLSQQGNFEIEYVIQDGGSTSDVIDILKKWEVNLKTGAFVPRCNKINFHWYSEKDSGMYDAIMRGFAKGSGGDIMAWINTDDKYHSRSFQTVTQIFSKYQDVYWLTGIPNSYNEYGGKAGIDLFPKAYSREFIKRGYYDVHYLKYGFNWIQQESSFWRRSLWEKIGEKMDADKKYAADFYLWQSFAKHADLVKVYSFLGGYRCHEDQVTADPGKYRRELKIVPNPPKGLRLLFLLFTFIPVSRRLFYNKRKGYGLFKLLRLQWDWMVGRTVRWSFSDRDWKLIWEGILD